MEISKKAAAAGKAVKRLWIGSAQYRFWLVMLAAASGISSIIGLGYMESIRRLVQGAADAKISIVLEGFALGISVIGFRMMFAPITSWLQAAWNRATVAALQSSMRASDTEEHFAINDNLLALLCHMIQLAITFLYFSWINMPLSCGLIIYTIMLPMVTIPVSRWLRTSMDKYRISALGKIIIIAYAGGLFSYMRGGWMSADWPHFSWQAIT